MDSTDLLADLFQNSNFELFELDTKNSMIRLNPEFSQNKSYHSILFMELQKITSALEEHLLEYSIELDGSIIVH